ncbi:MAG: hypothetical protein PHT51_02570 [Patescibacteria group bacterium]|nr:hypothetical protein [Patescibacteria group bacterium]
MSKKIKIILILSFTLFSCLGVASFVFAQTDLGLSFGEQIGLGSTDPRLIVANVIRVALGFLGIIAVGIIIYAGWMYMTAAGNAEQIEKAKKTLKAALIGLIIILMSFAIASFVISRIMQATGVEEGQTCAVDSDCTGNFYCCSGTCKTSCVPGGCVGLGCASFGEFIYSNNPSDRSINNPRNSAIVLTFNKDLTKLAQDDLNNNIKVEKIYTYNDDHVATTSLSAPENIIGLISSSTRQIIFRASADCGASGATNCLPEWSGFQVTVNALSGIKSINGNSLTCQTASCTFIFATNDAIDTSAPTAGIAPSQICKDDGTLKADANLISGWANDDLGLSFVKFYEKKSGENEEEKQIFQAGGQKDFSGGYQTNTANMNIGENYTFKIKAYDATLAFGQSEFTAAIKPGHCCNGIKDSGEIGIDCGGDCLACEGGPCNQADLEPQCSDSDKTNCNDNLCSTAFCACKTEGCICQTKPMISWVTPIGGFCENDTNKICQLDSDCTASECNINTPNGATGNLVTIGGRNFGSTIGQVWFTKNDGTLVEASLANTTNSACVDNWSDRQIIAVVPDGVAANSPIKIKNAINNYEDSTNDNYGPNLPNFVVNNITRPGICQLNPNHGKVNDVVTYNGVSLSNVNPYFGDSANNILAVSLGFSALNGQAKVPNLSVGLTSTFVKSANNLISNYLNFVKDDESSNGTTTIGTEIATTTMPTGAIGCLAAGNTEEEKNAVCGTGNICCAADTVYAGECRDSLVKCNQRPTAAVYEFEFIAHEATTTSVNCSSITNEAECSQSSECCIDAMDKNKCSVGSRTTTSAYCGYYLCDTNSCNKNILVASTTPGNPYFKDINECEEKCRTSGIPASCLDQGGSCTNSQVCCPAGSTFEGLCKATLANCRQGALAAVYEFEFSTGKTGSQPGDPCDGNSETTTCEPDNTKCAGSQNLFCDPSKNCTCQPKTECATDQEACGNVCCVKGTCQNASESQCIGCPAGKNKCGDGNCCNAGCINYLGDATSSCPPSCSGYNLNQCLSNNLCPNSPGQCSPYQPAAGTKKEVGDCNYSCNGIGACASGSCEYNSNLNKCVKKAENSCSLNGTAINSSGESVEKYCSVYNNENRWHFNSVDSCPTGWTKISGNKCVNMGSDGLCNLCADGYKCLNNSGVGICGIEQNICSGNAKCESDNKCKVADQASCDCCCRKANGDQDCCSPLKCEGGCGSDAAGTDFGVCTGCASAPDPDAACNCSGHFGKFCDVTAAGGKGVCSDCTKVTNLEECSSHGTCCVDAMKNNVCRGGTGDKNIVSNNPSGLAYCAYYKCSASGDSCDNNKIASSTNAVFYTQAQCTDQCKPGPEFGKECSTESTVSEPVCDTNICNGFSCLNQDGSGSVYPSCGVCCCDPNAAVDQCAKKNPKLTCHANRGSCSGANRGLCCGCSQDSDCGGVDAIGCGGDTCCHPRPAINSKTPIGNNICRNTQIQAQFNSLMDITSFKGNIIVVGDYEDKQCPINTTYLSLDGSGQPKIGFVSKIYKRIARSINVILKPVLTPLFGDDAFAQATSNFCAIEGTTGGQNSATYTTLTFSPKKLLDPSVTYYAIIKGEEILGNKKGILSKEGVGFKGVNNTSVSLFNGLSFANAEIWSFKTLANQGEDNNGICLVDKIVIEPDDYLFNTTESDVKEIDDPDNLTKFDIAADNDKVFTAYALSSDDQVLNPVLGAYDWTWTWKIDKTDVLATTSVFAANSNKQLIQAQNDIVDDFSWIHATASTSGIATTTKTGDTQAFVFVCENPWPPIITSVHSWSPWEDQEGNCQPGATDCKDTNYKLYYCRDAGGEGTADDLPAIQSNAAVIQGARTTTCVYGANVGKACKSNADCGGGLCQTVLKESYFFRSALPVVSDIVLSAGADSETLHSNISEGNKVNLNWSAINIPSGETFKTYKVYYGLSNRKYFDFIATTNTNYTIENLDNGKIYYFAVTAIYVSGAESAYSNEVLAVPWDTQGPTSPIVTNARAGNGKADIVWKDMSSNGDASRFRIFYKAEQNCNSTVNFGTSVVASKSNGNIATTTILGLANNNKYCFGLVAYDQYGNPSATTTAAATPISD